MEQTLFSRKQLAERWGYPSTKPIETLETKGVLKRVPNFDGVRYSIRQIEEIESVGINVEPLSPLERKRLEKKIEQLEKEKENLYKMINNCKIALNLYTDFVDIK